MDFKPLVVVGSELLLVNPSAISLAIRAMLADRAASTGRADRLAKALLEVHASRLSETRFVPSHGAEAHRGLGEPIRSQLLEASAGRYVHVEQVVGGFLNWRTHGFGEAAPADPVRAQRIVAAMRLAQEAARARTNFRFGVTLYLMGGCRRLRSIATRVSSAT